MDGKSEDRIPAETLHLKFAYYVTGHGFGHATRVVEVLLDCGAVQADALTVDRLASLEKYSQTAVVPRALILATEVDWLKSIKANLVISDVVPVACRAAADAGIPSVCVTNFSWDFIYAEYVMEAGYDHRSIVWQIAEDYSHCLFLLRLPGFCPMPAFRDVIDVPLVVRKPRKSREEVRKELGIGDDVKLLVLNFGGQDVIFVARAPGRLDVMGGIADYSGSLVLQMPIREACHVAVQRSHPNKQRLWKHALARQNAKGGGFRPVMQIVSFGSEMSNRAPTFDMDLGDFIDANGPITYEKARKYFAQDPSQKWAAYVAGTILVLIRELGVQFDDGISILVSSGVPDGKGVSSSAALEVATMSAIAAAHGLIIRPRELALLCQKVENHIVGAPCGVMDQMTAACGEANKLLAMVCQPAEVREHVNIPTHIRFWGIDSGLRHSVGGADYGSVRVGTFMGRQIIKSTASTLLPQATASSQDDSNGVIHDELDEQDPALLEKEATLDYLCNLQPHRYEAIYRKILPEKMSGQTFLDMYGHHNDPVTTINPMHTYVLKDPTAHPIYENFHVNAFAVLLTAASTDEQLSALGELLYQSHYSYSKCGLGSDGTDRLVTLVQQMQHRKKDGSDERKGTLFGAKITGGGSGGTVCVLGRNCIQSSEEIIEIQQRYRAATGHLPFIFEGSSPGAGKFGYLKIKRRIHARS